MAEKPPQTEGAVNQPVIKNPYREGTKLFTVAKRLLSGDVNSMVIAKEVGVNVHSVYNARSVLGKLGYHPKNADEVPDKIKATPQVTVPPRETTLVNNPNTSLNEVNRVVNTEVVTPVKSSGEVKDVPSELNSQAKGALGAVEDAARGDSGEKKSTSNETLASGDAMERTAQRVMELLRGENRKPPAVAEEERKTFRVVSSKDPVKADEDYSRTRDDFERIVMVEASPILKKVALNPKVYLWYDYARSKLGYKGDVGDFVIDSVEDFWKSRGYRIVITQGEEVIA